MLTFSTNMNEWFAVNFKMGLDLKWKKFKSAVETLKMQNKRWDKQFNRQMCKQNKNMICGSDGFILVELTCNSY